jgi:hypothetical protein
MSNTATAFDMKKRIDEATSFNFGWITFGTILIITVGIVIIVTTKKSSEKSTEPKVETKK